MDPIQIAKWMKQISQLLTLVKLVVGLFLSFGVGMVGVVLWFSHTTEAIASTQLKMDNFNKDYNDRLKEWTSWRVEMDRNATRMLAIQEAQQKLMERLTDRVDRLGPR